MNTARKTAAHGFTQFELTTNLLRNLYKLNLTPVTKLVLLELTTHLNEEKNGSVVFPSIEYIANVLGIGLTAAKKAINDLIKEGLIIKSKRNKIKGNFNKYAFTQKVRNLTSEQSENEFLKQSENDCFYKEQKKETKKEQQKGSRINFQSENILQKYSNKTGGNVYSDSSTPSFNPDDEILQDYAIKHGAKSVKAYVNTLKSTGSAAKIIKEYKQKQWISKRAALAIAETKDFIKQNMELEKTSVAPVNVGMWVEFGKKIGIKS